MLFIGKRNTRNSLKKSHCKLIINGLTESHVINRKRIKRIQSKEYIFLGLFKFLYRHELILPVRKKPIKSQLGTRMRCCI